MHVRQVMVTGLQTVFSLFFGSNFSQYSNCDSDHAPVQRNWFSVARGGLSRR
jgi:hypothetical protein